MVMMMMMMMMMMIIKLLLRICSHFTLNSSRDEMHFLFYCLLFDDLKNTISKKFFKQNSSFRDFDYQEKVLFLFNDTYPA